MRKKNCHQLFESMPEIWYKNSFFLKQRYPISIHVAELIIYIRTLLWLIPRWPAEQRLHTDRPTGRFDMGDHTEAGVRRHHRHRHQVTQHQEGLARQLKGDRNLLGWFPHHANRDRWVDLLPTTITPPPRHLYLLYLAAYVQNLTMLCTLRGLDGCGNF